MLYVNDNALVCVLEIRCGDSQIQIRKSQCYRWNSFALTSGRISESEIKITFNMLTNIEIRENCRICNNDIKQTLEAVK